MADGIRLDKGISGVRLIGRGLVGRGLGGFFNRRVNLLFRAFPRLANMRLRLSFVGTGGFLGCLGGAGLGAFRLPDNGARALRVTRSSALRLPPAAFWLDIVLASLGDFLAGVFFASSNTTSIIRGAFFLASGWSLEATEISIANRI
jgi:hypothetical protein